MSQGLTIAEVLEIAAVKLEAPGAWQQGKFVTFDAAGEPVCFCAMGVLGNMSSVGWDAIRFIEQGLPKTKPGGLSPLADWNDDPDRTQAEVVSKFREAAALARAAPLPVPPAYVHDGRG